jgi:hypothetical protein
MIAEGRDDRTEDDDVPQAHSEKSPVDSQHSGELKEAKAKENEWNYGRYSEEK